MVTIEQKLMLFSKLLNQSMDKKYNEEFENVKDEYENLIKKNKEEIDKEAEKIEVKARKEAEMKRVANLSKSKVLLKKEIMSIKKGYYDELIEDIKKALKDFVVSDKYKIFIKNKINILYDELENYENKINSLIIYVNNDDFERYKKFIEQETKKKFNDINVCIEIFNGMIGGFIVKNPDYNFKIDFSFDDILTENEPVIMQILFETLEAGDHIGR